jgi:para-nitrobenzyl esterase
MAGPPIRSTRRAMLLRTAALGAMTATPRWGSAQVSAGSQQASQPEFVQVDTVEGRLRGQKENGICIFRGVRYAAPPLGKERFKAPAPLAKWSGARDALVFGHPALQTAGQTFGQREPAPDEDCLVLNVWTPAVNDGRKRPVMFYCHGGGFSTGSGASASATSIPRPGKWASSRNGSSVG